VATTVAPEPAVTLADVHRAAQRLAGVAHRTPVLRSRSLDGRVGAQIFFKAEVFQRTGSFKFRGAYHCIAQLPDAVRRRGILTYSSGNHAQAVACAGRMFGVRTVVVMPTVAPSVKRAAAEVYGAEVVLYDPATSSREQVATELERQQGLVLVPPYDDPAVVAGQGTVALELLEQAGPLDALLVPCGGGGLLSGCALVLKESGCTTRVIGVEPALADDATRSFRTGVLHRVEYPPTLADGLRTPSLGQLTFALIRRYVDEMWTVSEEAIREALWWLWTRLKVTVEPSAAVGFAALLTHGPPGGRVGVVLSGGNVDPLELFGRAWTAR